MTAPDVAALCDDLGTLREAIAREVSEWEVFTAGDGHRSIGKREDRSPQQTADAVLALPEFTALLDEVRRLQAAVTAVQEVAAWCEEQAASRSHFAKVDPGYRNTVIPYEATAERLRAALSGEAPEDGGR